MATRSRRVWTLDNQGQYARQIGRKRQPSGKVAQHKFRLGGDLKEAQRREQRLRELWEQIEAQHTTGDALWTPETLDLARQIAKGAAVIELPQQAGESPAQYARRLHLLQRKYVPCPGCFRRGGEAWSNSPGICRDSVSRNRQICCT